MVEPRHLVALSARNACGRTAGGCTREAPRRNACGRTAGGCTKEAPRRNAVVENRGTRWRSCMWSANEPSSS